MSRITFKFLSVEGKGGSSVLFDGIQCARGVFKIEFDLLYAFVYINSSINFLCTCAKRVLSYRLIQVPWCESKFGSWPTHEVSARFHNEARTIQLHRWNIYEQTGAHLNIYNSGVQRGGVKRVMPYLHLSYHQIPFSS